MKASASMGESWHTMLVAMALNVVVVAAELRSDIADVAPRIRAAETRAADEVRAGGVMSSRLSLLGAGVRTRRKRSSLMRELRQEPAVLQATPSPTAALGPGPYPHLMWVRDPEVAANGGDARPANKPTVKWGPTAKLNVPPSAFEECYGCQCLDLFPDRVIASSGITSRYNCFGSATPAPRVPEISWAGRPMQHMSGKDDVNCTTCGSFAVTMEDLDYPNGIGEVNNAVRNLFWAVNIPPDWTELTEANAFSDTRVTVGQSIGGSGPPGLELPCPTKGKHRYKLTLWALSSNLGACDGVQDVNFATSSATSIVTQLQDRELARVSVFATFTSPGQSAAS